MADEKLIELMQSMQMQMAQLTERLERIEARDTVNIMANPNVERSATGPALDADMTEDESDGISNNTRRFNYTNKDLSEELKIITEFNGHNISVETFIFEIKSTIAEIPKSHTNRFIRLIMAQKIIGDARKTIDGNEIHDLNDLIKVLRLNFGESKSYDISILERSQCRQGRDNILMYNKRFNITQQNIKRAIANDSTIPIEHKKFSYKNEERHGLVQYIRGLNHDLRLFVKAGSPQTLNEAQTAALESEKEERISNYVTREDRYRTHQNYNDKSQHKPDDRTKPSISFGNDSKIGCYNCSKTDHFSRDCPKQRHASTSHTNFQDRRPPKAPPHEVKYTESQIQEETQEPDSD